MWCNLWLDLGIYFIVTVQVLVGLSSLMSLCGATYDWTLILISLLWCNSWLGPRPWCHYVVQLMTGPWYLFHCYGASLGWTLVLNVSIWLIMVHVEPVFGNTWTVLTRLHSCAALFSYVSSHIPKRLPLLLVFGQTNPSKTYRPTVELEWLKHLVWSWQFVLDMGSPSHWRFILAPVKEANGENLGMSFWSSIKW